MKPQSPAKRNRLAMRPRNIVIAIPMLWLMVFFLIPFLVVAKISFSEAAIAMPPYTSVFDIDSSGMRVNINFENYLFLIEDPLYIKAYFSSIKLASFSTLLCLMVAYPMAYYIARCNEQKRNILLMLVILPFWTSFLLRVYAWIGILKTKGVLNHFLLSMGMIDEPFIIMQTDLAVYIGIVYTYLPFMVLPLYATLVKLDSSLVEAASDLGAPPWLSFLTVTLPLSLPGIVAGCLLVFIPAVGEYVIPELLGGPKTLMIGKVLWTEFAANRDWPVAAAVAIIMLIAIVVPVMLMRSAYAQRTGEQL